MTTLASLSPAEVRALGGLVVSCAGANEAALGMRALSWYNSILRLGLRVPFVVVHDLGAAMLGAASSIRVPADLPPNFAAPVPPGLARTYSVDSHTLTGLMPPLKYAPAGLAITR
jgi:hypothetical protein